MATTLDRSGCGDAPIILSVLTPNTVLRDSLFGDLWVVEKPEVREDGALFYIVRGGQGEEFCLAEWAVPFFEVIEA